VPSGPPSADRDPAAARVLVLEDSPGDAGLVLRALSRIGRPIESRVVDTRAEFERALEDWSPALILSDYTIPGFDGGEALQIAQERAPLVPFVFVSGTIGEERAVAAIRMGAADYILKESLARLPHAVTQALDFAAEKRRRLRSEQSASRAAEELRRHELFSKLGALVAGVAHEVRTPLFSLSATLDAFEARLPLTPEALTYVERLRGDVERLNRLMGDLLTYGRSGSRDRRAVTWGSVVALAGRLAEPALAAKGVKLEVDVPGDLPLVVVDPDGVARAIHNLIDNATHHSSVGMTVRVAATTRLQGDSPWLECVVEDSGPGFRPGDLERVFEPFYSKRKGGTGLGLAIVERTVGDHGGQVEARNRDGGGALVRVLIPAADSAGAEASSTLTEGARGVTE